MQISYHSTLTKIQKLQNLKKKKKYVPAGIDWNWLIWSVFKLVRNVNISILVYIPVWYISIDMTGTGMVSTMLLFLPQTYPLKNGFSKPMEFLFEKWI